MAPMSDRVAAIVLAAGTGSRFGGGKLLATIDGRPVLQHVLDRLSEAGIEDVVVVLGGDADAVGAAVDWRRERRVTNERPERGLASSLVVGRAALSDDIDSILIVLGDQPTVRTDVIRAVLDAPVDPARPVVVPAYEADRGRNPVLVHRDGFALLEAVSGDRGLGPVLATHPERVLEVPVFGANPDVDTRADLVGVLEAAWAARVRANRDQVDRVREVPDGADFYAPVSGLFRADPSRTDEPSLDALLALVEPGETWLDIGAGAGRYALPIAAALASSRGSVIAVDPSSGMLDALREDAAAFSIANIRVVEGRWPPTDAAPFGADVALIAHVSYDVEAIGPFLAAMEAAARRLCVAVLMERQPASVADSCWPPVHEESRIALPALPEFVELLRAHGRRPEVVRLAREPRRFESRVQLEGFLRRQLWIEPGGEKDVRFQAALDEQMTQDETGVGLGSQRPMPIGIVTWAPREP
jgi:molybdenum cofactor cytidylyltransferase